MSTSDAFLADIESRKTIYKLDSKSTISDERIHEIVNFAVKHVPSAFNVQSARAVILLMEQHQKLWDIGDKSLKAAMPEAAYQALAPKVAGFRAAYGSVC